MRLLPPGVASALAIATLPLAGVLLVAGSTRADTLGEAQKRVEAASRLVELWVGLAERDEREDLLLRYQTQTEEDFKKRDRVRAEVIVELLADKAADKELRLRAVKVLQAAAALTGDPDLVVTGRDAKKRKQWAKEHLLPLLTREDEKGGDNLSRAQAAEILNTWFKGLIGSRDASDVANYDATKKKTWDPAAKAWREVLRQ